MKQTNDSKQKDDDFNLLIQYCYKLLFMSLQPPEVQAYIKSEVHKNLKVIKERYEKE